MVTRLYTPLIPVPTLPSGSGGSASTEETSNALNQPIEDATQSTSRPTTRTAQQQAWLSRQPATTATAPLQPTFAASATVIAAPRSSSGAASVTAPDNIPLVTVAQHTQAEQITGSAVLHDFGQTADLLGAPESLKAQLSQYMGVVAAESRQPQPDSQLIATVLQRAAKGLDNHVTQSLGQPSTVVGEWVQALLQQPIDWSDAGQTDPSSALGIANPLANASARQPDQAVKTQVLDSLAAYRSASTQQNWPDAHIAVDTALQTLAPYEAPDLKGKFYRIKGKLSAQQGDWQGAVDATQQAIEQTQGAGAVSRLPQLWQDLGRYHQQAGELPAAQAAWESGLSAAQSLPDSGAQQGALWHDMGQLALQTHQPQVAAQAFQSARQLSPQPQLQQAAAYNLALAHRLDQQPQLAERAYRDALSLAKSSGQPQQYKQTLAQLTSLYIEQGQVNRAQRLMPLLSRLQSA